MAISLVIPSQSVKDVTSDKLEKMMTWLQNKFVALREDMGFQEKGCFGGWMQKRDEAQKEYENDFTHRENRAKYSALYRVSNTSINLPKRAVQVTVAKINEQLLNQSPFISLSPLPVDKSDPAVISTQELFQEALMDAGAQRTFRRGVRQAYITGESVMKIIPLEEPYTETKSGKIWMMGAVPLKDSTGGPVWENDEFEDSPDQPGMEVLKRDPSVVKPMDTTAEGSPQLGAEEVTQEVQGVRRELSITKCHWSDFLCSLQETSIHEAEHIHQTAAWMWDKLFKYVQHSNPTEEALQWKRDLVHRNDQAWVTSETDRAKETQGEKARSSIEGTGKITVCESWFRYDINEDGLTEEYVLFWDVEKKQPIFFEKMEFASKTKKRPFEVIVGIEVEERWYGMGYFVFLSNESGFIDRQLSKIDARESTSGRFTWIKKKFFPEIVAGKPLVLNNGHVWETDAEDPSKAFGHVELPAMDQGIWPLVQHMEQNGQLMSGTMTPGDNAMSGFKKTENTATAADIANQTSELLSSDALMDPKAGIEAVCKQALVVVMAIMDMEEAADRIGAEKATAALDYVKKRGLRKLVRHLSVVMTKIRSRQQLQTNGQIWQILTGGVSYVELVMSAPQIADMLEPILKAILQNLDFPEAEKITQFRPAAPAPQANANGAPNSPAIAA